MDHTPEQRPASLQPNGPEVLDNLHRTFIQNVSHELRTPLTLVQGYAELLRDGDLGTLAPPQQQAITVIVDRAHELQTLVERVGILLAIEGGMSTAIPVALDEIAGEIVDARQAAARQAGLKLEKYEGPGGPFVASADPYHLRQAMDCLVDNAIKFTPPGGQVHVRVYAEAAANCLSVSDTGIGIAEHDLQQLFARFRQVDGSTTRSYGGIGLGLTVAQSVMRAHGGQIDVESRPGQGSRFTLKLPALHRATAIEPEVENSVALRRILVVDDEEKVAMTIRRGLEKLPGCEITVANSGEEALRLFAQKPYDLLITDYRMPGMDGMSLAVQVRRTYPQSAIIMITAYSSDELREQAAQAFIEKVLDKPIGIAEIRGVALEALGRREGK